MRHRRFALNWVLAFGQGVPEPAGERKSLYGVPDELLTVSAVESPSCAAAGDLTQEMISAGMGRPLPSTREKTRTRSARRHAGYVVALVGVYYTRKAVTGR